MPASGRTGPNLNLTVGSWASGVDNTHMAARFRMSALGCVVGAALAGSLSAQGQRMLTVDTIYDPATRTNFSGRPPAELTWIDGDTYFWARPAGNRAEWVKVDAVSGRESSLFDAARMEA